MRHYAIVLLCNRKKGNRFVVMWSVGMYGKSELE